MKQHKMEDIKHSLMLCKMRLKNLEPHIENSQSLCEIYNKVVIEKAVLRTQLLHTEPSLWERFTAKLFNKREKRICDYF